MKIKTSILMLTLSIATPALAVCLFADPTFSPEMLCGLYAIAGILFIAVLDYSPRRPLALPNKMTTTTNNWTQRSFAHPKRLRRATAHGNDRRLNQL